MSRFKRASGQGLKQVHMLAARLVPTRNLTSISMFLATMLDLFPLRFIFFCATRTSRSIISLSNERLADSTVNLGGKYAMCCQNAG
ncbi:hypothetical protein C8J56DRAFT_1064961 [Mycena floridula]|nr:hypothetical protein C8J56DRAFT_1064961 [Mycena floridula]